MKYYAIFVAICGFSAILRYCFKVENAVICGVLLGIVTALLTGAYDLWKPPINKS